MFRQLAGLGGIENGRIRRPRWLVPGDRMQRQRRVINCSLGRRPGVTNSIGSALKARLQIFVIHSATNLNRLNRAFSAGRLRAWILGRRPRLKLKPRL